MTQTPLNEIAGILRAARRILMITHISPDGDAIGSLLGLGWVLRALPPADTPRTVKLVSCDGISSQFQFLPGAAEVLTDAPAGPWDAVVGLDASDPKRLGAAFRPQEYGSTPVLVLDHHVTNLRFGTVNWVDPTAAATAQIIVALADALDVTLSPEAATCLLTGVITDTRSFRTSNVTLAVMQTATRLMEAGAHLGEINDKAVNYKPYPVIRLWGPVLETVRLENHVIWVSIPQSAREQAHAPDNTDGGLVSFLINAPEANISVVFNEKPDGQVEIGFRSRPGYDVSQLALSMGGGGHPQASGCTVDGPLTAAEERVLPLVRKLAA
jgi:phosphoesterase RecJ-like protein